MADIKAILWTYRANAEGEYPIMFRITKNRVSKYISFGYSIAKKQWDRTSGLVKKSHANSGRMNNLIRKRLSELQAVSLDMETQSDHATAGNIRHRAKGKNLADFFQFAEEWIGRYNNPDSIGTYKSHNAILNKFREFTGKNKITFKEVDATLVRQYMTWLADTKHRGNNPNTITTAVKKLKAIYNAAIREGYASREQYPFDGLKLPQNKTQKQKLTLAELNKIRDLNLVEYSPVWHARNIFIFCFNMLGMRIGDALTLRISNIQNDRLLYAMGKSDKLKDIALTAEALQIINWYRKGKKTKDYIFPFLKTSDKPAFDRISSAISYLNGKLIPALAKLAKIDKHITTHVARHTWSQLAKINNVNHAVIQEALGHSSVRTTEIYLNDFENDIIDEANRIITGG